MARPYQPGADMSFFCPQNFCISYFAQQISKFAHIRAILLLNHMIKTLIRHEDSINITIQHENFRTYLIA